MPRMKVLTWSKPTGAAPVDEVKSWGHDAAWPVATEVKAVLLLTESAGGLAAFAHGIGTGLGVRADDGLGGANAFRAWAGSSDGGAFGLATAITTTQQGSSLATGDSVFTGHGAASAAQIIARGVDQFTVRWSPNDSGARIVHAIALGDIEDSFLVPFTIGSGDQEVTGVPFCSDMLVAISVIPAGDPGSSLNVVAGLGFANHDLEQFVNLWTSLDSGLGSPVRSNTGRYGPRDGYFAGHLNPANASTPVVGEAALTGITDTGFTYTGNGGGTGVWVLCLKGIASQIGITTKPTGAAPASHTIAVTDMTHVAGIILAGTQDVTQASPQPHDRLGIGAWDGTSLAAMAHTGQDDHRSTNDGGFGHAIGNAHAISRSDACMVKVDNDGVGNFEPTAHTTPVEDARLVGVGLTSSLVGLSWTVNDAVATRYGYVLPGSGTHGACAAVDIPLVCDDHVTDDDIIAFRYSTGDSQIINQVHVQSDHNAETGQFEKLQIFQHRASLRKYGPRGVVRIAATGLRTDLGGDAFAETRAREVFRRWGDAPAPVLQLEVFSRIGVRWQAGDIVCVTSAFIPNLLIGGRGLVEVPFEVVDCRLLFGVDSKAIATLIAVEALPAQPEILIDITEPTAPGVEGATTRPGLFGVPAGVLE